MRRFLKCIRPKSLPEPNRPRDANHYAQFTSAFGSSGPLLPKWACVRLLVTIRKM